MGNRGILFYSDFCTEAGFRNELLRIIRDDGYAVALFIYCYDCILGPNISAKVQIVNRMP